MSRDDPLANCRGVSVDLFGTLVAVDRPDDPAEAIGTALANRGIEVPPEWARLDREQHLEVKQGAELPLAEHVTAALSSRDDTLAADAIRPTVEAAVRAAFTVEADRRPGVERALKRWAKRRPVAVLSNCAVTGLAEHALETAGIGTERFAAVVTSVGCGWRKPDQRAFAAVAAELGIDLEDLLHVGDDPRTDGGVTEAGGSSLLVGDGELAAWGQQWG